MKKLSADPKHPYYDPQFLYYEVFLNGNRVYDAVTANAEEGWIETVSRNEEGCHMLPDNGDNFVYEKTYGNVLIYSLL